MLAHRHTIGSRRPGEAFYASCDSNTKYEGNYLHILFNYLHDFILFYLKFPKCSPRLCYTALLLLLWGVSKPYTDNICSQFFSDLDFYKIWRVIYPLDRRLYNLVLQVSSQIDYFLVFRTVLDRIKDCSIGIQTLSDDSSITLTVSRPYEDSDAAYLTEPDSLCWVYYHAIAMFYCWE